MSNCGLLDFSENEKRVFEIVCLNNDDLEECYEKLLNYLTKDNVEKFPSIGVTSYPNIDIRCTYSEWTNILFHLGLDEEPRKIAFY